MDLRFLLKLWGCFGVGFLCFGGGCFALVFEFWICFGIGSCLFWGCFSLLWCWFWFCLVCFAGLCFALLCRRFVFVCFWCGLSLGFDWFVWFCLSDVLIGLFI